MEELHADRSCPLASCSTSDGALAALPPLPRLTTLSYSFNARMGVKAARALLARAPGVRTLWIEGGPRFLTAPARKLLEGAGVEVAPRPESLPA